METSYSLRPHEFSQYSKILPSSQCARTNYDRWQKMTSVLKKTRCFDICRDVRSHFYFFFALPLGIFLNRRLGAPQGGHE